MPTPMKVPLLDLKGQYRTLKAEILQATEEIFESQYFILGPWVERAETEIAGYCGASWAVGASSGTDALLMALMAAGIAPGDSVITTPYTFFATAGSIARLGAKPLFADIDPDTYNISPQGVETLIGGLPRSERVRIKALMPVHLYGQCADMQPLFTMAQDHDLVVIEDAAQAIGAEYRGRRAGSMGAYGCFSFFPSKNLGAFGDGGMVTTCSKECLQKLKILRNHGSEPKYYHHVIGGNFRLDALQAAVVSIKLKYLDQWTAARQQNARKYAELFAVWDREGRIRLPLAGENRHIYNQFVIRVSEERDRLRCHLTEAGIGTEIYYPVPLHLQPCFTYLDHQAGDFPAAEAAARQTLALPIYPELTDDQLT
ncbi:MAG: DegT/DnrJ/EryC1/StrS family aminotransferase, partial [Desulfobacterales bacterium]|nr:DegT/DnrJ/EryC1/StrS family aminotransferase [Desulfobacterales bacterium]